MSALRAPRGPRKLRRIYHMHVSVPTAVLPIVLRSANKDVEVRKMHPLEFTNPVIIDPSLSHTKSSTIL